MPEAAIPGPPSDRSASAAATPPPERRAPAAGDQATLVNEEARAVAIRLPERIGQYRICRAIGRGGMGTVYEAIQEHPHRPVALKVMNAGLASRASLRRFEYESQILGRLRHPGIAQIYESGTHDDGTGGVPFYAMEFIPDARTLTQFAEQRELGVRDRLELFVVICEAVHHGHQKGVIHRDLKPHNILVDGSGQPKIIDFGIARMTDADLSVSLQTRAGDLVGTVPYMSPEQCAGHSGDLDTRSDVYALGVVLYELLTGKLPYDVESVALVEATRIIRDAVPMPLKRVRSDLSGDVEAIVFKALEKERERRYQSAHEFALDIQRFLNSQPITARPPSLGYHTRMFARRNKALVTGGAAVFAALVFGMIGTTSGMVKARKAATTSQRITAQFQEMFSTLDAREGGNPDVRLADVMDGFAADLDSKLEEEPEVRAALHASMGRGFKALTLYEKAERELRKALEVHRDLLDPPHEELAQTLEDLSAVLYWEHKHEDAEPLAREALEMRRELFGAEHEAVARSLNALAATLDGQKRHGDAEELYREALEMRRRLLGDGHELVARSTNNLATCLMLQGQHEEAERYFKAAVSMVRAIRGDAHTDVAGGLSNQARCLVAMGRLAEAEPLLRDALQIRRQAQGTDNAFVARTAYHLADVLIQLGRLDEAEIDALDALRIRRLIFPPSDSRVHDSVAQVGRIAQQRAAWSEAEPLLRELVTLRRAAHPDGGIQVVQAEADLGACLVHLGQFAEAEGFLTGGFRWLEEHPEAAGKEVDRTLERLVALYQSWHKPEEAAQYSRLRQAAGP